MLRQLIDWFTLKKFYDERFQRILDIEVYPDLEFITKLMALSPDIGDDEDIKKKLDLERETYKPDGKCISLFLYPKVSRYLQIEYDYLHKRICSLLYPE